MVILMRLWSSSSKANLAMILIAPNGDDRDGGGDEDAQTCWL